MNMFKKNGGFTLVELIVVIAILAILAGIAVPAYSGYIAKAEQAADLVQLDAVKTAVVFVVTEADPTATVETIVVKEDNTVNVVINTEVEGEYTGRVNLDVTDYVTVDLKAVENAVWTAADGWELDLETVPEVTEATVPTT